MSEQKKLLLGLRFGPASSCKRKRKYREEIAAIKVANRMNNGVDVYQCIFCRNWHVGHIKS